MPCDVEDGLACLGRPVMAALAAGMGLARLHAVLLIISRSETLMRTTRAAANARAQILTQLKDDHKRVKKAYREFQKLDRHEDQDTCATLVTQVLSDLRVHATLEEELLYPAARPLVADESLVDEAEVEHDMMHVLIDQLSSMAPDDDLYAARFTVLCEYVVHHVKEEESELFPQLERARLDWEALAHEMDERRTELKSGEEPAEGNSMQDEDSAEMEPASARRSVESGDNGQPARPR
jgi:hemerythrin superfamily protein